ncbi:MAG: radical SAM protein [Candidatus Aminicenantes bacterium]|nr:radical SAM protein [Candidatus Aminicenantes bacterium]NIM83450.1 radical SAM protein [Candidatus Aminicenantes bacterium]NIN22842.1 radical SAM protein [Candidatus Aminicenantes bacterium]NIN46578.1 radical SAM protein [Candidatus Aminicenantes bacterium]NIN89481.1 radical SAM protein [Candidatus Aminicenantes bacterium]
MNPDNKFYVKLIHCGNRNITNGQNKNRENLFFIPMGLFPLANMLKQKGFDVEIIHFDLEPGTGIEEILDVNTLDAVGFDCHWIEQSQAVLDAGALIKKIKPGVFIFLGGFSASFFSREILENYSQVDAVIRGDGEIPIVELCRILNEKKQDPINAGGDHISLKHVPNLVWKEAPGTIIFNEFSYIGTEAELSQLDFADLPLLRNWEYYREICRYWTKFEPIDSFPLFFLEIGRGCSYNCSFCGGSARAQICINNRKNQVVRSVDSVISTIEKAVSYGYRCFLTSFNFDGSDQWYINLFRTLEERKFKISFGYESWGLPSPSLINAISAGCEHAVITISPDSADLDLRKKNKDPRLFYTNARLEECLDYIAAKNNLKVQLYFVYFLPYETEKTIFATMDYITALYLNYSHFTEIIYMQLCTDPGSLLFLNPHRYDVDIAVGDFSDYISALNKNDGPETTTTSLPLLSKPITMTDGEAAHLVYKINVFKRLFSFPRSLLRLLNETGKPTIISAYLKRNDFLMVGKREITPEVIKTVLFNICNENLEADSDIFDLIEREYQETGHNRLNSISAGSKGAREITIISESETKEMLSSIRKDEEGISIEFDIY